MIPAALVVALATALRLAWVLLVPTKPVGDFAMYLESAAYLVERGALDPEFVYMPGYVLLLALVRAAGGGWLAAKVVSALLAGLGAGAVYGIAQAVWRDRRAALAAGLLYALWPGGVAVASVTGTDMPAALLIGAAAWALVRWGERRPELAAALFGAAMGLAAWMRAVALPLAVLAVVYFRVVGAPWSAVARRAAIAVGVAVLALAPWALRNRLRYGETFFTDSHGGLTALVGANPDTDGSYSRSLNRMFVETTGYRLLAEPHRAADRAAYALARDWTRFEPAYALGLVATKAQRLLGDERALLYWPLYRAGVLPEPQRSFWDARRAGFEVLVDAFWACLVGAAIFGLALAAVGRRWVVLAFVPVQLALAAIYALFFAEARYHLPIALLLFPPAGGALAWLLAAVARLRRERVAAARELGREALAGALAVVIVLAGWSVLVSAGTRLRERHRWAVQVCRVTGVARLCNWRASRPAAPDSGVKGVWDGVGLSLRPTAAAETTLALPAGRYQVQGALDVAPDAGPIAGRVVVRAGRTDAGAFDLDRLAAVARAGGSVPVDIQVEHPGGDLVVRIEVEASPAPARVWLSRLEIAAR